MPLVLSLKEGHDFYVAQTRYEVTRINDDASFTLRDVDFNADFEVSDRNATEVMPDVLISSGGFQHGGMVRVVIDAPHEIFILRGELHRRRMPAVGGIA